MRNLKRLECCTFFLRLLEKQKASQLPIFFFFSPLLFRNNGEFGAKKYLLTIEQLKQFSYFPFAAMFYFEHVFALCMLINKNELEWFLLIICKEHPLHRSTNLFSRNHPTLCFWLIREGRQMPSTEQLAILSNWQMQPSELFYKESCS